MSQRQTENKVGDGIDFMAIVSKAKRYEENKESYHYLFQCMLKKPLLTKKEFYVPFMRHIVEVTMERSYKDFVKMKCNEDELDRLYRILMDKLNSTISELGLRVVEYAHEATGTPYVALITEAPFTNCLLWSSNYTADERYLLTLFVEKILQSDDGFFERNWAIFTGRDLPNPMNLKKVEALLTRLTDQFFLEEDDGKFTFGVRGAAELSTLIKYKYDPPVCMLCDRINFNKTEVVKCTKCHGVVHQFCFKMLSQLNTDDTVDCPNGRCKEPIPKGNRTIKLSQSQNYPPQPERSNSSQSVRSQSTRRRRHVSDSEEDEKMQPDSY